MASRVIVAGTDVSGSPDLGEQVFISLVAATGEAAGRLHRKVGMDRIHMVRLNRAQKRRVIGALDFTHGDTLAFCLHAKRQQTVNEIYGHLSRRRGFGRKLHIYHEFDMALLSCFRGSLHGFCSGNGVEIDRLGVECDADMVQTVRRWNMAPRIAGFMHGVSDAMAWCGAHGISMPGCAEMDPAKAIRGRVLSRMR